MSWAVASAVVVALGAGLVWAESSAPYEVKPSVILKASTGDVVARNSAAELALLAARGRQAEDEATRAKAEALGLRVLSDEVRSSLAELRTRVEETAENIQQVQIN